MRDTDSSVLSGATLTAVSLAAARSLPGAVDAALGTQREELSALLDAVYAAIGDSVVLKEWLDSLSADEVAANSYWHKNGFAKLVLHIGDDFRIRMHVWPEGKDRLGEFHPHGHRWNFASTVLCGAGLSTVEYQKSPDGKPYMWHRYVGGGVSGLRRHSEVRLEPTKQKVIGTGEQHQVDTSVIHTVHPVGDDLVATLVVQSRMLTDNTDVYCALDEVLDETTNGITPAEVHSLLENVSKAI